MKKLVKFLSLVLSAGLLASCNGAPLPYSEENFEGSDIDTPYSEYILPVTGISFPEAEKDISLIKGETHDYKFTLEPKRAEAKGVRWLSEDDSVATIENGKLTAVGGGKTSIVVSSPDDIFDEVSLKVEVVVPLVSFEIPEAVNLGYNKQYQISPVLNPGDSTQGQFIYTPSNSLAASVDENGLVTTNAVDGVCSIGVTSVALNQTKYISINVSEVHATSVTIDDSVTTLEVGKNMTVHATVAPSDAYEQDVIFSLDESSISAGLASITEAGVLTAYKEGTVTVTATNVLKPELHDSFDVTIFQVRADHINQDDVVLSNLETSYQFDPAYVDNSGNPVQPSKKNISYEIVSGEDYIELTEAGLVSFKAKGAAVVRISDDQLSGSTTKDVNVTCLMVASSVTISGSKAVYIGDHIELTVASNPERASLSDDSISIEATGGREFASIDDSLLDSQNKVTVTGEAAGTITLVATVGGVHSAEFKVAVSNKPFANDKVYLVGNKDFHSGTAIAGDSWDNAGKAFEFTSIGGEGMIAQHKATVVMPADTLFKVRHDAAGWCNFDDPEGIYDQVHGSAFETGDVVVDTDQEGYKNVKVVTTGSYDIYYKLYSSQETPSGTWWEVYIMQTPTLSLSSTEVNVKAGQKTEIQAHDYTGLLSLVSSHPAIATAAMSSDPQKPNYIEITGVSLGTSVLTVTDGLDDEATCTINVVDHEFSDGIFVVGNNSFASGTAPAVKDPSWGNPDKAGFIGAKGSDVDQDIFINFKADDAWKVRVGDDWDMEYHLCEGMSVDSEDNNNIKVDVAGWYRVIYHNNTSEAKQTVTVCKFATSKHKVTVFGVGATATFTVSNWKPELSVTSGNTDIATVAMNLATATATVTGVAIGSTVITVSDATGQEISVTVEVTASTTYDIYFTQSGDLTGTTYIHYWGGSSESSWPGVAMTNAYVNGSSQQVVKASIPADSTGILFHNNGGTQTVNIESGIANNKGYYLNGEWEGGHAKVGSWDVAFYTISYNANGGTGTMANDNAVCDVGWGLKANTFTRSGYVFTGWNTAADGSGISYSDQQLVPANTKVDGDTLTLYAQWQDVSHIYFIYFSKNSDYYSGFHDGLYIHYWGGSHGTDWPGVAVATFAYTDTYGNDVYVVQVPDDVTGMLFHNGSGTQTVDITSGIGNNKGFYLNGEWQDGKAKVGSWNVDLP